MPSEPKWWDDFVAEDKLVEAMFHPDIDTARLARTIWDQRHAKDVSPREPAHCAECFEGCPKCQPNIFPPKPIDTL